MKLVLTLWCTTILALSLIIVPRAEAGEVLTGVKARGQVRCGVSQNIPGFSEVDAAGAWHGLDVDFCRAVAAAVLGDPDKVAFVPVSTSARFPVLQTHRIDLLLGNTTWTLTREAVLKVQFPGILFFDAQGFMVPAAADVATLADLNGTTICVEKGTTNQRNLTYYFTMKGWSVKLLVVDSAPKAAAALFAGDCRAYTADSVQLAAVRLLAPDGPQAFVILPERISNEPISPVVWGGDQEWASLIRWVLNVLILAEQYGVGRDNLDAVIAEGSNPLLRATEDERELLTRSMGVTPGWGQRIVRAVGNYGEIYERNVGRDSPLKIERGLNRLWNQGGLHYAPPLD